MPYQTPGFIPPVTNRSRVTSFSSKAVIILIGCVLAVALGAGLLILMRANDPSDEIVRLQSMMQSLSEVTSLGSSNAKSPDVIKLATDASILVNGDISTLKTALLSTTISPNQTITSTEKAANKRLITELKAAATDARFDASFVPALSTQLEATQRQVAIVRDKTGKPMIKAALTTINDHLTSLLASLQTITL